MKSLYIGSGDCNRLLMSKETKGFQSLLQRFVSDELPNYNSKASPIDALRSGAILEGKFAELLPENYYPQFKVRCKEMDVLICSLDFAELNQNEVTDFIELKTVNFTDFLTDFEPFRKDKTGATDFIKKHYKQNYNQVQFQLLCTGLKSANIVFLAVYTYDDTENYQREIHENEYIEFRILRDEKVIGQILEASKLFQTIKDFFVK